MADQETAHHLFELLNKPENINDAGAAHLILNNPEILSSPEFLQEVALESFDAAAEPEKLAEMFQKSAQKMLAVQTVLNNLQKLRKNLDNTASLDSGKVAEVLKDKPCAEILNSNQTPNGETLCTQAIKNIRFMDGLGNVEGISPQILEMAQNHTRQLQNFLGRAYGKEEESYGANPKRRNVLGQKADDLLREAERQRQDQRAGQAAEPRKPLTIEQLREGAYRGTLTIDQANQLREHDNKREATLKNQDGDKNRYKREPSKDKFKDEDVIKYMYEDWFLGGASWLFDKTSNGVLNLIDAACDQAVARCDKIRSAEKKVKDKKLEEARKKVGSFSKLTAQALNGLHDECTAKVQSYADIFDDLKENLNNPHPKWRHYSADDPFILKLQENPEQAEAFIKLGREQVQNRLAAIETTGKIAMMATSLTMIDEVMRKDGAWRGTDQAYKSDADLENEFKRRARERHEKIIEAISVLSEDARLVAEIKYENLPEPKPDFKKYIQENVGREVNEFTGELAKRVKEAGALQDKEIEDNNFDARGDLLGAGPQNKVRSKLSEIDSFITSQIKKGAIFSEKLFDSEFSQERIAAKTGLYEAAVSENSPQSLENTFNRMKDINAYNQNVLNMRRTEIGQRRSYLQQVKARLVQRDGTKSFQGRINGGRDD